jgi:hypothetical protein
MGWISASKLSALAAGGGSSAGGSSAGGSSSSSAGATGGSSSLLFDATGALLLFDGVGVGVRGGAEGLPVVLFPFVADELLPSRGGNSSVGVSIVPEQAAAIDPQRIVREHMPMALSDPRF